MLVNTLFCVTSLCVGGGGFGLFAFPGRPFQALDEAGGKTEDDMFAEGATLKCDDRFRELGFPQSFSIEVDQAKMVFLCRRRDDGSDVTD